MKPFLKKKLELLNEFFVLDSHQQQVFKYLCVFSILYLFPLILANFYYIDDVGRFANSEFNWLKDGRPLMQLMGKCLGLGKPYLDIFPLGQVLSALILNYSLVLWGRKYIKERNPFVVAGYLALSYLNLFLLEAFSYVFESIGMTISFSLFLFLYALPDNVEYRTKLLFSMIAVVLSMSFYQASLGAYIGLAGIELILVECQSNQIVKPKGQCFIRALGFLLGTLIYYYVIAGHFLKGYGVEHGSLLNLATYAGIDQFFHHVAVYMDKYKIYGQSLHRVIIWILSIVYMGGTFALIQKNKRKKNFLLAKIGMSLFILIQPIFLAFISVVMFAVLQHPVYAPRVFLSFTVVFLYFAIQLDILSEKIKYVNILLIPLLAFIVSFSAGYGNLLHREDRHDQYIAQSIAADITKVENREHLSFNKVTFIGKQPESLELSRQRKKRPLMAALVPIYMNSDWYWGGRYLDHFRNKPIRLTSAAKEDRIWIHESNPEAENDFYKLYRKNDKIIISFCPERL